MTMTSAALLTRAQDGDMGDDDSAAKPTRRRFSAEYKEKAAAVIAQCFSTIEPRLGSLVQYGEPSFRVR